MVVRRVIRVEIVVGQEEEEDSLVMDMGEMDLGTEAHYQAH